MLPPFLRIPHPPRPTSAHDMIPGTTVFRSPTSCFHVWPPTVHSFVRFPVVCRLVKLAMVSSATHSACIGLLSSLRFAVGSVQVEECLRSAFNRCCSVRSSWHGEIFERLARQVARLSVAPLVDDVVARVAS